MLVDRARALDEAEGYVKRALARPDNGAYMDSLGWAPSVGDAAGAIVGSGAGRRPAGDEPSGATWRTPWRSGDGAAA